MGSWTCARHYPGTNLRRIRRSDHSTRFPCSQKAANSFVVMLSEMGMRESVALASLIGMSVLFSACASSGVGISPSIGSSLNTIGKFVIADLQNADEIALAQVPPDAIAHTCYVAIEAFVQNRRTALNNTSKQSVSGAFSGFEVSRASLQNTEGLISKAQREALEVGCAPLVLDTQNDVAGFLTSLIGLGAVP